MHTFNKHLTITFSLLCLLFASCVDKDYDEPPVNGEDPALKATHTIQQLKTAYFVAGQAVALPDTAIIVGTVISDDTQGNFYKDLVIQDSTGGILLRLDRSNLSGLMPVGRRLFVKCGGLYISDYNGLVQIGVKDGTGVGRIPDILIDQYVSRGQWNQPTETMVTQTFSILNTVTDQNTLVRLDSVHFLGTDVCNTWADMTLQQSANRTLIDKNGNEILVRTSNFATFGGGFIPGGTGSITGVLQVFGSDFQLVMRTLDDVSGFPPSNCVTNNTPVHTIADLRALFTGTLRYIPAGSDIEGIVISDKDAANITGNNIVLQDATAGITVRFTTPNTNFALGDKVRIDISNQELSEFNGLLEVNNVDVAMATETGTGTITPHVATIADINANGQAWESTLVQISGVTISGAGGVYSGTTTLTDATGTLPMFTRTQASFAGTSYPTSTVTVTGIVGDFNAIQLNIRNTSDVQ